MGSMDASILQLVTWTLTGLCSGWLARTALRTGRQWGLAGDLVTGWLGGVVGGWLFRRLGVTAPGDELGQVLVALLGAATMLALLRLAGRLGSVARVATAAVIRPSATNLEERIRSLAEPERRILSAVLSHERVARDPNQAFEAESTFGGRVADRVAQFGGSWTFIGLFGIVLVSWMAINEEVTAPFDPYPYILLNLVLSSIAALQAPVIMMSQNRQAARDRSDAKMDYEVNVRSEMEIAALHTKVDLLRERDWHRLIGLVERQQEILDSMQKRLDALGARDA